MFCLQRSRKDGSGKVLLLRTLMILQTVLALQRSIKLAREPVSLWHNRIKNGLKTLLHLQNVIYNGGELAQSLQSSSLGGSIRMLVLQSIIILGNETG